MTSCRQAPSLTCRHHDHRHGNSDDIITNITNNRQRAPLHTSHHQEDDLVRSMVRADRRPETREQPQLGLTTPAYQRPL
jgi:hypothetical protein